MCVVLRFWMNSHVEGSGVRTRFCDCTLPDICRSPNRSVASASRGATVSPLATNPARTIDHRRRIVMPPLLPSLRRVCRGEAAHCQRKLLGDCNVRAWSLARQRLIQAHKRNGAGPVRSPPRRRKAAVGDRRLRAFHYGHGLPPQVTVRWDGRRSAPGPGRPVTPLMSEEPVRAMQNVAAKPPWPVAGIGVPVRMIEPPPLVPKHGVVVAFEQQAWEMPPFESM